MPFGDYNDFSDCVAKNSDKSNPEAYCGEIKKKIEGRIKLGKAWRKAKMAKEVGGFESPEPGDLPEKGADILASTYASCRKDGGSKERCSKIAWGAVHKAGFSTTKMSGLAQIPEDYKKKLDTIPKKYRAKLGMKWKKLNMHQIGKVPNTKTLQFSAPMMNKYAELTMKFMREGDFKDLHGTPYFHPWEIIEEAQDTYLNKNFWLNHKEGAGLEYGKINQIYSEIIDGIRWLWAKVRIPEIKFTSKILDRIQNGLIKDVSSTHDIYSPGAGRKVQKMTGKGISLVEEGEVDGAEITDIKRNVLNPVYIREVVKNKWKKTRGEFNGRRG